MALGDMKFPKLSQSLHVFAAPMSRHPAVVAFCAIWIVLYYLNFFSTVKLPGGLIADGIDFDQYYAGGVVAAKGMWHDLYPKDIPQDCGPMDGVLGETLRTELSRRGANTRMKWIFPPPLALAFAPLSLFRFKVAWIVHVCFMILFGAILLSMVERSFMRSGFSWRTAQVLTFAMSVSMGMRDAMTTANITCVVGIGTALALSGMMERRDGRTVLGFMLPGLAKGTSAFWVPLLFLKRSRRTLVVGALSGFAIIVVGYCSGIRLDQYEEFRSILSSGRGTLYQLAGNVGIPATISTLAKSAFPFSTILKITSVASLSIFALTCGLAFRRSARNDPRILPLFLVVSLVLFNFFSNICWSHYSTHFFPLVPICLAICKPRNRFLFIVALFPFLFDPGILRALRHFGIVNAKHLLPVSAIAWMLWALFHLVRSGGDMPHPHGKSVPVNALSKSNQ